MWSKRENPGEQWESLNKFSSGNVHQKDVDT